MNGDDMKTVILEMAEGAFAVGKMDEPTYRAIRKKFGPLGGESFTPEQFRAIREKNGLSQSALAEKIGVSAASITKWENGRNPIPGPVVVLMKAIDRLGLTVVA